MKLFILLLCITLFSACDITGRLKYKEDKLFSSGYARKPEALVTINGKPCKSMGDEIGNCHPTIKRGTDIVVKIPEHPFSYKLNFICTSSLGINKYVTVPANTGPYVLSIPASKFNKIYVPTCDNKAVEADVFNCEGHMFPVGKEAHPQVSKFFSIRFAVYDKNYQNPASITRRTHKGKEYFVYGVNALYGEYIENGKVKKKLDKNTYLKIKNKNVDLKTWSCTATDRCNYYGY